MGRGRQQLARTGRAETMGLPWVTSQAMLCVWGGDVGEMVPGFTDSGFVQ